MAEGELKQNCQTNGYIEQPIKMARQVFFDTVIFNLVLVRVYGPTTNLEKLRGSEKPVIAEHVKNRADSRWHCVGHFRRAIARCVCLNFNFLTISCAR